MTALKLMLVAIIIAASFLIGQNLSDRELRKIVILKELKKSFIIIEKDINYSLYSIGDCFDNIAKRCSVKEVRDVFEELSVHTRENERLDKAFEMAFMNKALKLNDNLIERIIEIGKCIGYMDRQSNTKMLKLLDDELDEEINNKRKDIKDRQKVYKTVAITCGLYISLILI